MSEHDGRRDFDFLHGVWRVANSRLRKRLAGDDEWQEFPALNRCQPVIGGLGNVDSFDCERFPTDGRPLHGLTLRIFDPRTRLWSIYWTDDRSCELQPPVIGRFEERRGIFRGDDTFDGRPIRVRYVWTHDGGGGATWEQAFSTDGEETWETNWRMVLTRES
jgi:hypothetical protein